MAPVGYCSVSEPGLIIEANLTVATLLGTARLALARQPFSRFIFKDDVDGYYLLRKQIFASGEPQSCESRMVKFDGTRFWAKLDVATVHVEDGTSALRIVVTDISGRKRAEEKLQLAASVFTHAQEGIFITAADGTIIDVNATFSHITGYDRDEVLGGNPRLLSSGHHEKSFYVIMWRSLIEQGHWCGEIWNRHKNGEVYVEKLNISAVRDPQGVTRHYVALFSNITGRKQAEEALREKDDFNLAVLDSLNSEIAVLDRDGVIVAINLPWKRFATENSMIPGQPVPHVKVGTNYLAICRASAGSSADEAESAHDGIRAVLDGRLPSFSLEYPCHSPKKKRWFSMTATPFRDGVLVSHTDISGRKQAEEQLREMAVELEARVSKRTKQLRRVSAQLTMSEERERRMLAQNLHDDLGQLLAIIKIKLTSLGDSSPRTSINTIVELVEQADLAVRMITLQLSPPILHTLGLIPALEWLVEEMEQRYHLAVHIDHEGEPMALVDEIQAMLFRSVRELLINVARHSQASDASLSCLCQGSQLIIAVSDNGCGFDPSQYLVGLARRRGFGLCSIYERIINIGGEMEFDSSPGNGTTITLSLPYSIAAKEYQSS
jgi:PAS domain S-box-containing protein